MDEQRIAEIRERLSAVVLPTEDDPHLYRFDPTEGCWIAYRPVDCVGAEELPGEPIDLADLLAEPDRTTADLAVAADVARERDQEVERLRKVAEAVEALHRPIRVYDECDHDDCQAEQIEVCDYTACADSVIGWGCESCCYDEDYPIEDCPHGADHRGVSEDDSCPTHAAVRALQEGP